MASNAMAVAVKEPFPIFTLAHKYMLYDVDVISYIRQKYNICGVLIGGLPQAPQQNVFLGVPLELMHEEARLLVDKGVAYVVDDVKAHKQGFLGNGLVPEERRAFQDALRKQGTAAAREASKRTDERKKAALQQKLGMDNWNDIPEDMLKPTPGRSKKKAGRRDQPAISRSSSQTDLLFAPAAQSSGTGDMTPQSTEQSDEPVPYAVTPTTSHPPLASRPPTPGKALPPPQVSRSYPLFRHLHENSYFMTPGLRFGCQYTAYPGDPLRFHSHFLCNGLDWDEEFDLLDLVGGGRLGTGVKKGFLIGGEEKADAVADEGQSTKGVRTFCIEWGGM